MTNSQLKTIWDLQYKLNKLIGVDTILIRNTYNNDIKNKIFIDYLDEAINESFEAKENFLHKWWVKEVKNKEKDRFFILNKESLIVELIDIMHFLISAMQIMYDESCLSLLENNIIEKINTNEDAYFCLNKIINSCLNKNVLRCFHLLMSLFNYLNVNDEDIVSIYQKKHDINVNRQMNNYSQANKTEDDNIKLEQDIKNISEKR